MNSGIYRITNVEDGKVYIGSAVNFANRWSTHRYTLSKGTHPNRHLQNAWNKYGASAFVFEVLEEVEEDRLLEREQYYLDQLFENGNHYNVTPAAGSHLGAKRSPESRKRLSEAAKRKPASLAALEKYRPDLRGRKLSDETRAKMSVAQKGRVRSPESIAKSSATRKGWKHTDEAKAEMSRTRKGRKQSAESNAKRSAALKSKPLSEEHKAKIAAAVKAAKASDESKAKASAASKGRTLSEEHKDKLSAATKAVWAKKRQEGMNN